MKYIIRRIYLNLNNISSKNGKIILSYTNSKSLVTLIDFNNYHKVVEWADGHKHWYLNGQLHREDGPAIVMPGGYKEWWLNYKFVKHNAED